MPAMVHRRREIDCGAAGLQAGRRGAAEQKSPAKSRETDRVIAADTAGGGDRVVVAGPRSWRSRPVRLTCCTRRPRRALGTARSLRHVAAR
jgi:hypothetical protein